MILNPIKFQNKKKDEELHEITNDIPKCNYMTPWRICLYISDAIKCTLRKDLCEANENFESCFVEIDNPV